jgi:Flp pilus assembly protein TadG
VAVYFALAVIPMVWMVGASVDYGRYVDARSKTQAAMDAAVITAVTISNAAAASQFSANATTALNVTFATPPSFTTNTDSSVTGSATGSMPTTLLKMVGLQSMSFKVSSKAAPASGSGPGSGSGLGASASGNKVCILVLDPSDAQTLLVNGGFSVNGPNCEIDVASTGNPAAIFNSQDTLDVAKICVKGSNVIENGGAVAGLSTGCSALADPFAGKLPTVSNTTCTVSNQNYSGNTTLNPGVYCGSFNFNGSGTLTLNPGLYVFNGANWNLNSGWTLNGTGVTFYYATSGSYIQINSNAIINVSAPTSGTYANILMYEPGGLSSSSFTINGASGQNLTGLIYLPSRNVTFNSGPTVNSEGVAMVFNQLILDSNSPNTWKIAPGTVPATATPSPAHLTQ